LFSNILQSYISILPFKTFLCDKINFNYFRKIKQTSLSIINTILNRAYKNAKKVNINKNSKIIFFSDLHKGDNSYADDFAHNLKIYNYAMEEYYNKKRRHR